MKTYTIYKRVAVEVSLDISAETFAEAAEKLKTLKLDRFVRAAPGAELVDWGDLSGSSIHEERE